MTDHAARLALVAGRVREADPALEAALVEEAVAAAAATPAALRDMANALGPGPGALHAGAPPSVGRLVGELRARGSTLAEPVCVRCTRTNLPLTASPEGGVCKSCRSRQLATACACCGGVKPVAGRGPEEAPLCARCAPRPRRPCASCGQIRIIARRAKGSDGDLCDRCYLGPVATCGVCGRSKPCNFVAQGRPTCMSCSPRRKMPCAHCGRSRPPCAQWPEGPVCEPCYRAALSRRGRCQGCGAERRLVSPPGEGATHCSCCAGVPSLAVCRSCGAEERPYADGLCARCALAIRARALLGPTGGPLEPVYAAIVAAPHPYSAHNWLRSSASARILAALVARGELTHEALDATIPARAADFLRHLLVANGVLASRDEGLVRLEGWIEARLATVADAEARRLLRSYATWRLLRQVRQRAAGSPRPDSPSAHAKVRLRAAIALLGFLAERGRNLSGCTQADVDAWAASGAAAHEARDFLRWASERGAVANIVVTPRASEPATALDDDTRWSTLERLLHDEDLEVSDRVAGCLVLLYGQQLSRIVAITRDQLAVEGEVVRLRLGPTAIEIPEPLSGLLLRLARDGRGYVGIGSPTTSPWLFPGLSPGRPMGASHLGQRLRNLGIPTRAGRRAAMVHLASRLPGAALADLLGIAPTTAVGWVRIAGGDWTTYAAELARERPIATRAE